MSRKPNFKRSRYTSMMRSMTIIPDEYDMLKLAFQGGFTHANPFNANKELHNVSSFDFCSSYPAVMVSELFPMSSGEMIEHISDTEFNESLKYYCCLFNVQFIGLQSRLFFDSYISQSRCWEQKNVFSQNGRVVSADEICLTITGEDFQIIKKFYEWKEIHIGMLVRYHRGYLPKDFVLSILKLYKNKTTLKGEPGKEVEFMHSKEWLNSCYG